MAIVVGSVSVDVIPDAANFSRALKGQIEAPVDAIGQQVGQDLSDAIIEHLADAIPAGLAEGVPESGEIGGAAGAQFGDRFSSEIRSRIDAALKSLPAANVDLDDSEAIGKLADLRDQLIELGYSDLDVTLTDDEAVTKIAELRAEFAELSASSPYIRVRIDAASAQLQLDELLAKFTALDAANLGGNAEVDLANIGSAADRAGTSVGHVSSDFGLMQYAIGAAGLVAVPVLSSIAAVAGVAYLGIENAHVSTVNLTTAWKGLEAEAGKAIEPGLQSAVDELARSLPELNPLVDSLGSDIGGALNDAAQWLGDGGVKGIVGYLNTEVPIMASAFEAAGTSVAEFVKDTQADANGLVTTLTVALNTANQLAALQGGLQSAANPQNINNKSVGSISKYGAASGLESVLDPIGTAENGYQGLQTYGLSTTTVAGHGSQAVGPSINSQQLQQATGGLDQSAQSIAQTNLLNEQMAKSLGETSTAYSAAQVAAQQFATQTATTTADMSAENNAAGLLTAALQGLGGDNLGVAQTQTAFQQSVLALNTSLKQNGTAFQGNSAAALENQAAIQSAVGAAISHAQAVAQNTQNTQAATDAYNADITTLENQVGATGAAKAAIEEYVKQIGYIPTVVQTQLEIQAQINVTADLVDTANLGRALHDVVNNASGSFLKFYADGDHVAQMAPAGAMRVWAEPETGGESYIPHAASKRQRSEAILSETANLFGGQYIPKTARSFADGFVLRGSTAGTAGGAGGSVHNHIEVGLDGHQLVKYVTEKQTYNNTRL